MLGILDHRDVALRAVSAACKLVTRRSSGPAWDEFRMHVVSAVSEAFNNICAASNSLGRYADAVAACERALAINPEFPLARNNLAVTRTQRATAR